VTVSVAEHELAPVRSVLRRSGEAHALLAGLALAPSGQEAEVVAAGGVVFAVMTGGVHHEDRAQVVKETWCAQIDACVFISDTRSESLPTASQRADEGPLHSPSTAPPPSVLHTFSMPGLAGGWLAGGVAALPLPGGVQALLALGRRIWATGPVKA